MKDISADRGSVSAESINDSVVTINSSVGGISEESAREHEQQYLRRLIKDCRGLEWLTSVQYQDESTPTLFLDQVFTALLVDEMKELPQEKESARWRHSKRKVSLLEKLNQESSLVVTGDPGSGKSAFVNFVAIALAGELLGEEQCNLQTLTEPLPNYAGDAAEERQPWDHQGLLPVRIILRDFAATPHFPNEDESGDTCHLLAFLKAELQKSGGGDYYPILEQRLRRGKALVMFDGLDEVAKAGEHRARMIQCISGFRGSYDVRCLVTCRPYAYDQARWQIEQFIHTSVAGFEPGQIRQFIHRWYQSRPATDAESVNNRIGKLVKACLGRRSLKDLAQRPLLLTMIAYLHSNWHELPERRADLYEQLLQLLLDKWESARFGAIDADEAEKQQHYSLAEYLRVGVAGIRLVLERITFEAHARQGEGEGTVDIAAKDLTHELTRIQRDRGEGRALNVITLSEHLRDRVGILYQRGGESDHDAIYTFPHRSFQEYLAAAYFRKEEDLLFEHYAEGDCQEWAEVAAELVRKDPDRWREVVLLAGGINAKEPGPVWALVNALYPESAAEAVFTREAAWGLRFAAEIMVENLDVSQTRRRKMVERVRNDLPLLLRDSALNATERVAAGRYLATLEEPRRGVTELDGVEFCYVPPGRFFLGSEDENADDEKKGADLHEMKRAYWLARYPVTVAQYRQYLQESQIEPGDENCLTGAANTPVVWVNQKEAQAFCDWLDRRWRQAEWLPDGYRVTLPSEPEWEKAAKGGDEIPAADRRRIYSIAELAGDAEERQALAVNPMPRRDYPWGDGADPERMNYEMNIGAPSAMGAYPGGASPYGCEEMSGNVWEWTRSHFADYPYPTEPDAVKEREKSGGSSRVLRGGAF
ncbi:MAG: SUMF1/EgtB/PvdO family nonheme iron enzyme, partial [Candidatus Sedimenticola sp. (ex Thyasira tokunagai)]